ncbi:immunoglobulin domain-containing protein [Enterobacter phage ST22]|nr:immunoglobulin domain-containing protein [Enterobacter phage ST22]
MRKRRMTLTRKPWDGSPLGARPVVDGPKGFTIPGFDTTHIYPVGGVEDGYQEAAMGQDWEINVVADDEALLSTPGLTLTWRVDPPELATITPVDSTGGIHAIIHPLMEGNGRVYCKWELTPDDGEASSTLEVGAAVVVVPLAWVSGPQPQTVLGVNVPRTFEWAGGKAPYVAKITGPNNLLLNDENTTDKLITLKIDGTNQPFGDYTVEVEDADGSKLTATTTVIRALSFNPDLPATGQEIAAGSAISLSVTPVGGTPPINFEWYHGTTKLGGATNTYNKSNAVETDSGIYKAVATDNTPGTPQTKTSRLARVRVYAPIRFLNPPATFTVGQPITIDVMGGKIPIKIRLVAVSAAGGESDVILYNGTSTPGGDVKTTYSGTVPTDLKSGVTFKLVASDGNTTPVVVESPITKA